MRISVTTIDTFRQYRDGITNWDGELRTTEADLITYIKKVEFVPNEKMLWGRAFHELMETLKKYKHKYIIQGNTFYHENIKEAFKYRYDKFPWEIKSSKDYIINDEIIKVVGMADQLVGMTVIENKTRWSNYKFSEYFNAFQWRFYLSIFNSPLVVYQIFNMVLKDGTVQLKGVNVHQFTAYQKMEEDINSILRDFVEWIHFRNMENYFKDKK